MGQGATERVRGSIGSMGRVWARWAVVGLLSAVVLGCGIVPHRLTATAGSLVPTSGASEAICGGVPADIGGCSSARPSFSATTCAELAAEWGDDVDRRIVAIIDGPKSVDGKAKSVRNYEALVLASTVLSLRLDALGLLPSCDMAEFWPIAQTRFSPELQAGAGDVLYDGDPASTYDQWLEATKQIIGLIDTGE